MKRIKTYKEYKSLYFNKLAEQYQNDNRFHYIYRITDVNNNKHYYGSRVSINSPKSDLGENYFSSSRDEEFIQAQKSYKELFKYKIIKIFDNTADKILYESFLHQYFDVKTNDKFFNLANSMPNGFDTTGYVVCLDVITGNISYVPKLEFDKNANLVGIAHNTVVGFDPTTDSCKRVTREEFRSNPNLLGVSFGKVTCLDKKSGSYVQVTKEEFYSNDNLVGVLYNMVNCIDKKTKKTIQVTKEEFDSNDNLVGVLSDIVTCIDKCRNEIKQVTKEEFDSNVNLVGICDNMVPCVDLYTNEKIQVTKEEFYGNDQFLSINDNMVVCKYIGTEEIIRVTKEEFDSNPNLVGTTFGAKLDFTQAHKDNISKGTISKPKSESHKKNMSLANKGRVACKLIGTEELIFVSQDEFNSNPNLVGITRGFIPCICTVTGKRTSINPSDLGKYPTFVQLNSHKLYTVKYPDGDIKVLTDIEFTEEREIKQLSNPALMKSYELGKPVEKSLDFYNKSFNQRIKNSIGFQILYVEKKLY